MFKGNDIFCLGKDSLFSLHTIRNKAFHFGQVHVMFKKYGLNALYLLIKHFGNKTYFKVLPPLIKLTLLHTVVVLHNRHHIHIACLIKGGKTVKMFNNNVL